MDEKAKAAASAAATSTIAKVENTSEIIKESNSITQSEKRQTDSNEGCNLTSNNDFGFISGKELLLMPDTSIPCLYEPIIPQEGVGIFCGESDAGKSMFLRNLAICTATGRDFLGFKYTGNNRGAIYVSTEDAKEVTAVMLKKHNKFYLDQPENWENLHFFFGADNVHTLLSEQLKSTSADIIIIDSMADIFDNNDMNSSAQVRKFFKPYNELSKRFNCFILFLCHIRKSGKDDMPSKNSIVGSQSTEAMARVCLMLVKNQISDNIRYLCILKHNYLGPEFKREAWELKFCPYTFTYECTGRRIPIDQLGGDSSTESEKKESKSAKEYAGNWEYIHFINKNLRTPEYKTNILLKIKDQFHCGQNKAEEIINYFFENRWIKYEGCKIVSDFEYIQQIPDTL